MKVIPRKSLLRVLLVIFILLVVWFLLRFVVGGPEDSWICDNGQWVRHGNPSAPMPKEVCGEANKEASAAGIANPASVFCEEKGGILRIVTEESGGQSGICRLPNGTECEEWKYFRGECP